MNLSTFALRAMRGFSLLLLLAPAFVGGLEHMTSSWSQVGIPRIQRRTAMPREAALKLLAIGTARRPPQVHLLPPLGQRPS